MKFLSKLYLKLIGWKIVGTVPDHVKQCVMIAAPHTSNYDYPIAMAVFYALRIKIRFLGKKELFRFPLGILMRATGGIAVDRSKHNNLVEYMISLFDSHERLVMLIPPEGTRKKVKEWKMGFYHVALGANVPIMLGYLDYKNKIAGMENLFYPTGDVEKDMTNIKEFYKKVTPKYPNLYD